MMGIGHIGWQAPLHVDGFITDAELAHIMEADAVGEVLGQSIDEAGNLIRSGYHDRLTSFALRFLRRRGQPFWFSPASSEYLPSGRP